MRTERNVAQFGRALALGARSRRFESCHSDLLTTLTMQKFTVEEFQADFDNLLERVENGESFIITSEYGDAMMIPYGEYKEVDDMIRIHTDHEEGC